LPFLLAVFPQFLQRTEPLVSGPAVQFLLRTSQVAHRPTSLHIELTEIENGAERVAAVVGSLLLGSASRKRKGEDELAPCVKKVN
jgi:hypothetical protein